MKLSTQICGSMIGIVAITAITMGLLTMHRLESVIVPIESARLQRRAEQLAMTFEASTVAVRSDVLFLSRLPEVKGLVRETVDDTPAPSGGAPRDGWRRRLEDLMVAQLETHPDYAQLRFIRASDGTEIVRVDRSGEGKSIRIVPEPELQYKGDRPYMEEAMELTEGNIYVSPVELNQEHGMIEIPNTPVVRVATPVYDPDGAILGVVALNLDLRREFVRLRSASEENEQIFLINSEGDYLLHPISGYEFGFDLGSRHLIQDEYPEAADIPGRSEGLSLQVRDEYGTRLQMTSAPFKIAGGTRLTMVKAVPFSAFMLGMEQVRRASMYWTLLAIVLAAGLSYLVAVSLARQLEKLTKAVRAFNTGDELPVPTHAIGEIGVLSRAFESMASDIREKAGALEKQSQRDRLLSSIVESTDDAIITTTCDGIITSWNPASERMFGFSAAEAIGHSAEMLVHEDMQEDYIDHLERIKAGERVQQHETRRRRKDGESFFVSVTETPMRSSSGEIIGASRILRDITERKLAEEKFRLAVEVSPNGIVLVNENGEIILVNAETERMFGYTRDELLGATIELLLPERFRQVHPSQREAYHAKPERRRMGAGRDLWGLHKNGTEFPIEIGLNHITTAQGLLVMGAIADISARKATEETIVKHTLDLQRSNAELQQFAYVASHDLQEPLRMVVSFSELLAQRYQGQLDERADKYIKYIVEGGKRMQQLVTDLLSYSRVGSQGKQLTPTDSQKCLETVLQGLRKAIEDSGGSVVGDQQLPEVMADEGQLRQLLQNLVSNALKFRGETPPKVEISAEREEKEWVFRVRDNGIGINEEYAERVFQMFQRLHDREEYEGSGIGLAIAKRIVERHGGRIWLESTPGMGTTFYFTLSAAEPG